ncbi:mannose-6-phosphate isomerase [Bacillus methanolicus PB1]|uniref:Mannose-6-phosphate isomerase n=1 Tax=Bacillus methanolicus PB1 TaxID=997296 RepID=I3E4D1_BACMT|nr:sugar phosphate nucleotidyltransferase [Bacillus methanolicus]EIJ81352.1 mannose-6-phosphate isomerase [Bacillus methanolicus PB1]
MKLILLSGGSGKRLWPLSNESRSKQFLKILPRSDEELESMVQRIWRQLDANQLVDDAYISTSKAQADIIQSQLGTEVPLIIEPERRDTFPAIALASTYLYSTIGAHPDEVITVMPVDPFVENQFFNKVKDLEDVIGQTDVDIALIGVNPTYPSTKYGYIIPDKDETNYEQQQTYIKVKSFKEKPTEEQAQRLIKQHALWNCGVFAFKLGYIIKQLEKKGLPARFDELIQHYDRLPKISFDYEIVEKADRIKVIPYNGYWKDLGTWNTLTEEMETNMIGSGSMSEDCSNTHLINELDIPVIVLGASNMVVATSPDGILVTDKAKSHLIKEFVNDYDQRPMFEERRWGWYRVLDYKESAEGTKVLTKRLCVYAGKNISYQYHHKRSEVWVVVAGEGEFVLDGALSIVKPGDVLNIPVGAKHGIKALKDLEIIEVQMGSQLVENDIVRLFMSWEEMKKSIGNE